MATKHSSEDHEELVRSLTSYLKKRFYRDIRASIDGFEAPKKIAAASTDRGYVPDVTMIARGDQLHIFAVETPGSIASERSGDEWAAFASYAESRNAAFWVVVPQGSRQAAEARLNAMALTARVWEL